MASYKELLFDWSSLCKECTKWTKSGNFIFPYRIFNYSNLLKPVEFIQKPLKSSNSHRNFFLVYLYYTIVGSIK